jgi:type IV pilus assembly protein PilM
MLFGKKNQLVGLDIGSRTIKAAEVVITNKGRTLKQVGMVDIAPGLIEDGIIKDLAGTAEAVRQLFKSHNFRQQNVAIAIGGYSTIVKKISVPTMAEEQLQETIQIEAEQYIPFDINDVNLDFQILEENEQNPSQMTVLLVAAKQEVINDYIQLIELSGLNTCIIDVESFALQNIYEISNEDATDNVALIDIGASKTSLNILKGTHSVFMRDVSMGCGQINQKIVSLTGCSASEAESIKFGDTKAVSQEQMEDILVSVSSGWCAEIRRALDFFYSTYPEGQVQRVLLSGGGADIGVFRKRLGVETSAKVETINPFTNIHVDTNRFDPSFLKQIAPQAAISMGLAIRRLGDK